MDIQDCVSALVVVLLLTSTFVPIVSGTDEDVAEKTSTAPYKEFNEPDDETLQKAFGEKYLLTFNYTYNMDYEVVPENLVMVLNGTCTSYMYYYINIDRPDDEVIRLVDKEVNESDHIDEIHSVRNSYHVRENVYEYMRSTLRRQEEDWTDPGEMEMVNPTKVIFGELDEDVLVDPHPLKGEYEITITILGRDMEMNYGEKETKLALMSDRSVSEPRNLEGEYEDGKVELEWKEPEEKEAEIRQYNIYRANTLHGYEYIGNVSGDQTEYVDELEEKSGFYHQRKGDILYYRVVAINENDHYYVVNSPNKRNFHIHYRQESTSLEEIVYLSPEKTEKSDMGYKWVMNYSSLSEEDFEDRVGMDSVNINKMEGGDVFFYDINKVEEENGIKVYEYEGGFFSKGETDMVLEDGDVSSELNIVTNNSWFDFSGEIWAEETSGPGYEGLKILNQSIRSEGRVRASLNNTFDFPFKENETHWRVSKELDINWTVDLQLDYDNRENNGWIVSKENETLSRKFWSPVNLTGSIDSEGTLVQESNHLDEEKKTVGEISTELQEKNFRVGGLSAQGKQEAFSPIVGAGNIGYYLALDETLDKRMGSLEGRVYTPLTSIAFSTNCQRDGFSTEKLYRDQYMDPMALPGMGSFLGTSLKRANLTNDHHLEIKVEQQVRAEMEELEFDCEEAMKEYKKSRGEELLQRCVLGNPWGIQQYNGIYGWNTLYGAHVIEPLGYFASEPLSEDEINSYHEDREKFFEDQIKDEEPEEDHNRLVSIIILISLITILLVVTLYTMRKAEKQN